MGTLSLEFILMLDMRSNIRSIIKSLAIPALIISLLSGCVTVPEEVQLTHNGKSAMASIPAQSTALDASGFSLTSWNISKGKLTGWDQDLDHVNQQSDLLLLQEAHLVPELRVWLEQASLDWAMAHAFALSGSWSGVLTSGKVPQLSPCAQRIQEPYLRLPKTALISYFPLAEHSEPLLVANIHGVNFTLGSSDLAAQLQAIRDVMDVHSGPIILAGDFNTWSNARMNVVKQLAASHDLQLVTFQHKQPAEHFGHQLDHIYYRGLIPLHSHVTEVASSDHYPLTVTFSLDTDR
jgi:endonuclease/exonuclease/phosphatase (EEP) superfamily protein YafD